MRFFAIFPVMCTFIAIVLSFLCLFAGSKPGYMEDYAIVTLNTSRIAVNVFDPHTHKPNANPNANPGILGAIAHDITHEIAHLTHKAEADINAALTDGAASFAAAIGLHDFYSVHVLDFCEGYYSPAGTAAQNVTHCSSTTGFFAFKPAHTLARELNASGIDISLSDLHWPSAIDEAVESLALAFNVMFVLYCAGIAAAGAAFWTGLAGIFFTGRVVLLLNIFLTQAAFLVLLVASAIVTGAATSATDAVNKYGAEIDVNATRGDKLIQLSWTAMFLMLLASCVWMTECCVQRRKEKKIPKEF